MGTNDWKQADMTYRGRDHAMRGMPCQDKTAYAEEEGLRVIALADGAGSMADAELGAWVTVKAITDHVVGHFDTYVEKLRAEEDKSVRESIVASLHRRLHDAADKHGTRFRAMGATLLFAAVKGDTLFHGHIGDGVIGAYMHDASMRVLSEPENGFLPNITFFVTEPKPVQHLRLHVTDIRDIRGVVLMSDGPQSFYYDKKRGFIDETSRLFTAFDGLKKSSYQRRLHDAMEQKLSRHSADDLSLNILYRQP